MTVTAGISEQNCTWEGTASLLLKGGTLCLFQLLVGGGGKKKRRQLREGKTAHLNGPLLGSTSDGKVFKAYEA